MAPFLPPGRPLGRALGPAEAVGQRLDGLGGRDDLFELGRELLDLGGHGDSPLRAAALRGSTRRIGSSTLACDSGRGLCSYQTMATELKTTAPRPKLLDRVREASRLRHGGRS